MEDAILVDPCPRCGEKHIYSIPLEGLYEGVLVNLGCTNITRYIRLRNFHFNGIANFLKHGGLDLDVQLVLKYGN